MAFEKPIESLLKQCKICKLMQISGKLSYQVKIFNVSQFMLGFVATLHLFAITFDKVL